MNADEKEFEAMQRTIEADEARLRGGFHDTPQPSPQVLARIKSRLRTEIMNRPRGGRGRPAWLVWAGSVAAIILLAAGTGLYYYRQPSSMPTVETVSLDVFAASLAQALHAEDPDVQQFGSELQELESQTANTWNDANTQPAARPEARENEGRSTALGVTV